MPFCVISTKWNLNAPKDYNSRAGAKGVRASFYKRCEMYVDGSHHTQVLTLKAERATEKRNDATR